MGFHSKGEACAVHSEKLTGKLFIGTGQTLQKTMKTPKRELLSKRLKRHGDSVAF